ncbi:conjugal transfer trbg/virb9/cagx [Lucifera butyrica]|uniref:Conjugal transfer trbg/virb9/cagx n=1 Tax=Lucifera butyrica TaxID=1351585 RepID=A0A498RAA8_9FIRM|nr:TrbG/VirB9 family P-type conjugative transfer protein [Lucifera butyrica]VBB08474.1 conjugal transfer trbg/virb9/cagx [Lucifera butyrica]
MRQQSLKKLVCSLIVFCSFIILPLAHAEQIQDAASFQDKDIQFVYDQDDIYKVYTTPERLTEVRLQPGETIRAMFGGDTSSWLVEQALTTNDNGPTQYSLFIKPTADNINTNVIISTDRRTYRLMLCSANWYNGIIQWSYPKDEQIARQRALARLEDEITIIPTDITKMNRNYKIKAKKNYLWKPVNVYDYEGKTYIKLGPKTEQSSMPVLFVKEGKNLQLVNYRIRQGYFIVDRICNELELVSGKDVVIIKAVPDEKRR